MSKEEIIEKMARRRFARERPGCDWQEAEDTGDADDWLKAAADDLSAIDGWVLVPREPTAEMYVRGDERIIKFLNGQAFVKNESTPAIECYRAMIAAATP